MVEGVTAYTRWQILNDKGKIETTVMQLLLLFLTLITSPIDHSAKALVFSSVTTSNPLLCIWFGKVWQGYGYICCPQLTETQITFWLLVMFEILWEHKTTHVHKKEGLPPFVLAYLFSNRTHNCGD